METPNGIIKQVRAEIDKVNRAMVKKSTLFSKIPNMATQDFLFPKSQSMTIVRLSAGTTLLKSILFQNIRVLVAVVDEEGEGDAVYYDILGRVVTNPQQGCFYIKNIGNKATNVVF